MSSQLPLDQVPSLILNIQDILGKNPSPPGYELPIDSESVWRAIRGMTKK